MMENQPTQLPQYIQIANELLMHIESGKMTPGEQLYSERKLSGLFGVSRLTIRRSLEKLEEQGVITRQHGKGNYVSVAKADVNLGRLVALEQPSITRNQSPGARIIKFEKIPASKSISEKFDVTPLSPLFYIYRVRMINQVPVVLEEIWTPVNLLPDLDKVEIKFHPIYQIIEDHYGLSIDKVKRTLEPTTANENVSRLLDVEVGSPLMLVRRQGYNNKGQCIEFGKLIYRGDRFRFITKDDIQDF